MTYKCPVCRSSTVSHNIGDLMQCLSCGQLFNSKGDTLERGPDATTRAANEARMAPRTTNLAGNYADLQRVGAAKAADPKEDEFALPPGVDKDDVAGENSPTNQVSEVVAEMSTTEAPADKGSAKKADKS